MTGANLSTSAADGQSVVSLRRLDTEGLHFKDTSNRTLILRGVNLAGSAKVPRGRPLHVLDGFWESAEEDGRSESISYVGQTLNVEDGTADQHLARLKGWGFNCIRYVCTWEALEHEGP